MTIDSETLTSSEDQAIVWALICWYEQCYAVRGNAIWVWKAYGICRTAGRQLPTWVTAYLDDVGTRRETVDCAEGRRRLSIHGR